MRTELVGGESLVILSRKHFLYVYIPLLLFVFFIILYVYACSTLQLKSLAGILWVFPAGSLLLFAYRYFDRKYNIWVVTNHRVIDEWGIITHNAKETPLDRIQNITYMQSVLGRIFGFGDIRIQTAATSGAVVYTFVENPKLLKDSVIECQNILKESSVKKQAVEMAAAMTKAMSGSSREKLGDQSAD
jgi:uncharacterized membrane protein YdbT with pleckstrin-like domain